MTIYPEDPYTDEDLFGDHERCEDEIWESEEDYEAAFDVDVSAEDYEKRRIA